MNFFLVLLLLGLENHLNAQCLINATSTNSTLCIECEKSYYYDFSVPYSGWGTPFQSSECRVRSTKSIQIEIFITPNESPQSFCDGSPSYPFTSLLQAFLNGWKLANPYMSSSVAFKLLGNGLENLQEDSVFFLEKMDYPSEYQFLFRNLFTAIKIEAAYCNSTFSSFGCIKNLELRPKIFWRTGSLYIFISKAFYLINVILDGRDQYLSEQISQSYYHKKVICSEDDLGRDANLNSEENVQELTRFCSRKDLIIDSKNNYYGIFNIEQLMNSNLVIIKPLLYVYNSTVKNFLPFGTNFSVACFVRLQILGFDVIIENASFAKNYFPDGVFSTNLGVPPHFTSISSIYFSLRNDFDQANNTFLMKSSVFSEYNYYQIIEKSVGQISSSVIMLKLLTWTAINITETTFLLNKGLTLDGFYEGTLIQYNLSIESYFFVKANFKNLKIVKNYCKYFFQTLNLNFGSTLDSSLVLSDISFIENINTAILLTADSGILCYALIFFSNSMIVNHMIETTSFLKIYNTNFDMSLSQLKVTVLTYSQASNLDLRPNSLMEFRLENSYSEEEIFSILRDEDDTAIILPILLITDSIFFNIATPIVTFMDKGILQNLKVLSSNFSSIFFDKGEGLFKCSVEKFLIVRKCFFNNISSNSIFEFRYGRNITFEKVDMYYLTGTVLKLKLWQGENYKNVIKTDFSYFYIYSSYPSFILRDCLFIDNFIIGFAFSTDQILKKSVYNMSVTNVTLRNIKGTLNTIFLKSFYVTALFTQVIIENLQTISFMSLDSSEEIIPSENITVYKMNLSNIADIKTYSVEPSELALPFGVLKVKDTYISRGEKSSGFFFSFKDFFLLSIEHSSFSGKIRNIVSSDILISASSYFGNFSVVASSFFNLSSKTGGALFISVLNGKNLLISRCFFFDNSGYQTGADLTIKTVSQEMNPNYESSYSGVIETPSYFGIHDCKFIFSKGGLGGSITFFEYGQFYVVNSHFYECSSSKSGGAIYLYEKTIAGIYSTSFIDISSQNQGGAVASYGYEIHMTKIFANNLTAYWGGFLFKEGGFAQIRSSKIISSVADYGGAVFAISCDMKIFQSSFILQEAKVAGGAIFLKKVLVQMLYTIFKNCTSHYQGAAIYSLDATGVRLVSIEMVNCTVVEGGLFISFSEESNKVYYIKDFKCTSNYGQGSGTCMMALNINLKIESVYIGDNYADNSLLYFLSDLTNNGFAEFRSLNAINNSFYQTLFIASGVSLSITNFNSINLGRPGQVFQSAAVLMLQSGARADIKNLLYKNNYVREYVISCRASVLFISDIILSMNKLASAILSQENSKISIDRGSIFKGQHLEFAGGITAFDSDILLNNLVIADTNGLTAGAIYAQNSLLIVKNTVFLRNSAGTNGSTILSTGIQHLTLLSVKAFDSHGLFVYLDGLLSVKMTNLTLKNFIEDKLLKQNLYFKNIAETIINQSCISDFSGGSVLVFISDIQNLEPVYLSITDSIFSNNYCKNSGGALFLDSPNLIGSIIRTQFINNTSQASGGAILYNCWSFNCTLEIKSCVFARNKAYLYASVIKGNHLWPLMVDNKLSENFSPSGSVEFVLYPSKLIIFDEFESEEEFRKALIERGIKNLFDLAKLELRNVVSGRSNFIVCVITDALGNFFKYDSQSTVQFLASNFTYINIDNDLQRFRDGMGVFPDLIINAYPGENFEITVAYLNEIEGYSFNQSVHLNIRKCIKGEIVSGLKCNICIEKFYSLEMDPWQSYKQGKSEKICQVCPENAICPGGKVIIPNRGFWRKNDNQSKLIKCPVKGACLSFDVKKMTIFQLETYNYTPECDKGYFGNLCYNCDQGYGRSGDKECTKCSESRGIILRFLLMSLVSIILILLQTRSAFSLTILKSKRRALVKILLDHFTFISFMSRFNIPFGTFVENFFNVNDQYISAAPQEIFNFDCFYTNYTSREDNFIWNSVLVSLSPVFYVLILIKLVYLWYLLVYLHGRRIFCNSIKKAKKYDYISIRNNILSIGVVVFYNFYHRLLMNGFNFLKCMDIDDSGEKYLEANPDILCSSAQHNYFVLTISIPTLVLWGIMCPVLLVVLTIKLSKNKPDSINQENFNPLLNYLTLDYINHFYYWDFFTYTSKLVIMSSSLLSNVLDPTSQGAVLILIFLVLLIVHLSAKPYRFDYINKVKTFSYIAAICTAAFAIIASNEYISAFARSFCVFCLFGVNALFYLYWLLQILKGVKLEAKEKCLNLKEKFRKIKN